MLDVLIAFGLALQSTIGIGDIISLAGLAKGLIERIGEKDALSILKKALDETIKKSKDDKAKSILKNLKKNDEVLPELRKLNVSEESKRSLVSQYFNLRIPCGLPQGYLILRIPCGLPQGYLMY